MDKLPLPPSYHKFVDKRQLLGVNNGYNVLSNLAVFAPAFYLLQKRNVKNIKSKLLAFHITLIAITSTYYHMLPSNGRVFWDMLSIATTHAILLSYFVEDKVAITIYGLAIISVIYWYSYNDLRPYIVLLTGIPVYIISQIYDDERVKEYIGPIIFSSVFARYLEYNDANVYRITNKVISGHTAKHFSAGMALYLAIEILDKLGKL